MIHRFRDHGSRQNKTTGKGIKIGSFYSAPASAQVSFARIHFPDSRLILRYRNQMTTLLNGRIEKLKETETGSWNGGEERAHSHVEISDRESQSIGTFLVVPGYAC